MPGEALANDAANPCVGCGPANPRGLGLSFRREGDAVRAALRVEPWMQGWPERLHSGVLYTALLETANWTVYGLAGRVGVPTQTSALDLAGWARVGALVELEGRLDAPDATAVAADARVDGARVGSLRRTFEFPDRASFLARFGYDPLPEVLAEAFPR